MIQFLANEYPDYYESGTRPLTEEEKNDRSLFHHHKNEWDLVCSGLNMQVIKAFLAQKKKKAGGKTCSHVNLRKCFDAINFGSMKAKQPLPKSFYDELNAFLDSFKIETKEAKKPKISDKDNDKTTATVETNDTSVTDRKSKKQKKKDINLSHLTKKCLGTTGNH